MALGFNKFIDNIIINSTNNRYRKHNGKIFLKVLPRNENTLTCTFIMIIVTPTDGP